jgi:hypothetical protein
MDQMDLQPYVVPNKGSAARDFCMLERNLLSHLKLALLLSILSSSILLRARLVPEPDSSLDEEDKASLPLAGVLLTAALATMGAGAWEYNIGYRDLMNMTAFLQAIKSVFAIFRFSFQSADTLQSPSCCDDRCGIGSIWHMHCADRQWIIKTHTSYLSSLRHESLPSKAYQDFSAPGQWR